jgi:alkyl hydroperoxide reductase subunit AhpC
MINPGNPFPHFTTAACVSLDEGREFGTLGSADLAGKWLVLYTYPKDFTFVCPTEIVEFDRQRAALEQRGAVLWGGSTDNEYSHLAWRKSEPMLREIRHPLLFVSPSMAQGLDVLHPAGVATRATIIADPKGIVRFASSQDLSAGRNVEEVVRVLDALLTGGLTACNWKRGDATLSPR